MINRKVVLVLGAGASKPYGFPLGCDLIDRMIQTDLVKYILQRVKKPTGNMTSVKKFQEELRFSVRNSIDAFLESNPQYMEMGKEIIALLISRYESYQQLYETNDKEQDWYRYLFNLMLRDSSVKAIQNRRISFITYNYDRSLEFFLFNALKRAFPDLDDNDCLGLFNTIPIVHIHGKLGEPRLIESQAGREYRPITTVEELQIAAKSIRIISEDIDRDPVFISAHNLLMEADVVLFLGFGYHRTNIERLRIEENCKKEVAFAGTTLGMTSSEITYNVLSQFRKFNPFTVGQQTVLDFIRDGLNYFII